MNCLLYLRYVQNVNQISVKPQRGDISNMIYTYVRHFKNKRTIDYGLWSMKMRAIFSIKIPLHSKLVLRAQYIQCVNFAIIALLYLVIRMVGSGYNL